MFVEAQSDSRSGRFDSSTRPKGWLTRGCINEEQMSLSDSFNPRNRHIRYGRMLAMTSKLL